MSIMGENKVSVYIITYNNERTIERCLRSVAWADEIVVVDSYSTDRTLEICRRYTDKIYQRPWTNYREQYQFAADKTTNRWIMFIDADEEVSPELAEEIRQELPKNDGRWAGYMAPRRTYFLGRWIKHGGWYPDYEIRLYDRTRGRWEGGLYARVRVNGKVKALKNHYLHYTYRDIFDQLGKINRYSEVVAEEMREGGKRFSLVHLLLRPPFRFFRDFVLKRGFLDGLPGLIIAVSTAFYVFIKYAKLWEAEKGLKETDGLPPEGIG